MALSNKSFFKYAIALSGYDFKNTDNTDVFKFELFLKGVDPNRLLSGKTKYKFKKKI